MARNGAAALTACAVVVLLGVVGVGALAAWPMRTTVPAAHRQVSAVVPLPGQTKLLRHLPVVRKGGYLATDLRSGLDPGYRPAVHEVVAQMAARAGLGPVVTQMWARLPPFHPDSWSRHYPYSYPGFTDWWRAQLTPAVLAHRSDLLDLAALLTLYQAQPHSFANPDGVATAAASGILDALVAADPGDCDASLDAAGLVALGMRPRAWVVDHAFEQAVSACGDADPTARWWWVHQQASWASPPFTLKELGVDSARALARPLRTARVWEHDQPGSALPWAAEADALLTEADDMRRMHAMPFTVRAYAGRALDLLRKADALEHAPAFVAGEARAESLLGEADRAADTMAGVVREAPRDAAFRVLDVALLEDAHRWSDALRENAVSDIDSAARGALVPDGFEPTALGFTDALGASVTDATSVEAGGGGVTDLRFIPDFRADDTLPGSLTAWCNGLTEMRDEIIAGHPEEAERVTSPGGTGCDSGRTTFFEPTKPEKYSNEFPLLHALAAELDGATERRDHWLAKNASLRDFYEEAQNLFRWAGDLGRAEDLAREWAGLPGRDAAYAHQRWGEILYLAGRPAAAAAQFQLAVSAPVSTGAAAFSHWSGSDRALAYLDLGTALDAAGRSAPAQAAYRDAVRAPLPPARSSLDPVRDRGTVTSAWLRIGYDALAEGHPTLAVRALTTADRRTTNAEHRTRYGPFDWVGQSVSSGAEAGDLAVALLDAGPDAAQADEAVAAARRALVHDPMSPVYRDTLGQAEQAAGDDAAAAATFRAAVRQDPTLFQSWNDLGVLRSSAGSHDLAVHAYRMALQARPDYATAWFNLGVELGRGAGLRDLVASQRALARAVRLDPGLRGQSLVPVTDSGAELTALDVSRPVPVDWSFATATRDPSHRLGWVVLVLAGWRLALAFGLDHAGSWVGERALRTGPGAGAWARLRMVADRRLPLPVALAGALAVACWPLAEGWSGQRLVVLATAAAVLALLWLYSAVRRPVSTRRGWLPGLLFGAAGSVVGYSFVPMPVDHAEREGRVRFAGCVLLGVVAAALLVLSWLDGAPLARTVGLLALAMLSTALFPMRPYDGGFLREGRASVALSLGMLAVSAAVVLGWV